jgi:predicted PurR-regulated permease PerM
MEPNVPTPPHQPHLGILDEQTFSKYFLLILFVVSLLAFLRVIRIFILQIVLAAVFATLFYPLYAWFLKIFGNRRGISSFVSCLVILLGLLVPVIIISNLVILQGLELYHGAVPMVNDIMQRGGGGVLGRLQGTVVGQWIAALNLDWHAMITNGLKLLGENTARIISRTSQATVTAVIHMFIVLFAMFYFFRDGERILARVTTVIPLSGEYKNRLISRFTSISSATVKGTLFIAILQSFLGTITLWAFGTGTWLLWGVVMLVFALIPFVGTGAVLVPAGIIRIVTGDVWQGITIILISVLLISTIDNVLRPRLVGHQARMHDLLVFFSTLGGISVFGPTGFIMGPLIAAIFLTVLDIFSIEFQEHIEYPSKE